MTKVHDEPSTVTAAEGEVIVNGPDGVAVLLTPDAAAETSDRLLEQAAIAEGQRVIAEQLEESERARRRTS